MAKFRSDDKGDNISSRERLINLVYLTGSKPRRETSERKSLTKNIHQGRPYIKQIIGNNDNQRDRMGHINEYKVNIKLTPPTQKQVAFEHVA